MGRAIGIDLGTTNTAVAIIRDGRPRILEDDKGYNVFPSYISLSDDGSFLIGRTAKSVVLTQPERTAYAIKRLIGRHFDSNEVLTAQRRVSYLIEEARDGTCDIILGDQRMTPVDISARILAEVKQAAEASIGEQIDHAVITVPAYFNNNQRAATIKAAKKAGLKCERLLNEPTAAALAYGFRRDYDRTILIFDLGGGTFDVSILRLAEGVYETLSTRGDTYLGGEDFDYRLVDHLADDFQNQHGIDLREDIVALQRLKDAAELAKCELSFTDQTTVLIPRITDSHNLEAQILRVTLEELVEDFVLRTLDVTRRAIADADLQISDIEDIVLVGGQTRMPRVREAITGMFQKEPSRGVHPEEVVAIGAAVHASGLVEDDSDAPILLDVTPFDLGIDLAGGLFQPIVTRNTHIPSSATQKFVTARENQDAVRVVIRQGESKYAQENEFLGEFMMGNLTPGVNLRTQVEVTFRLDSSGMLHVSAVEPSTGERRKVIVRNYAEYAGSQEPNSRRPLIIEGGSTTPGTSTVDPNPVVVHNELGASDVSSAPKQKQGFFSGLFSRRKKPAADASAAPAAVDTPAAADAVAAAAGAAVSARSSADTSPEPSAPSIRLPTNLPMSMDEDDLSEDENTDHGEVGPAVLGMADSSSSLNNDEAQLSEADPRWLEPTPVDVSETQEIQLVNTDTSAFELSPPQDSQFMDTLAALNEFEDISDSFDFNDLMDPDALSDSSPDDGTDTSEDAFAFDDEEEMFATPEPALEMSEDSSSEPDMFADEDDFSEIDLGDLGFDDFSTYGMEPEPAPASDPEPDPMNSTAPEAEAEADLDFGELDFDLSDLDDLISADEAESTNEDPFHVEELDFDDLDTLFEDANSMEEEQQLLNEALPTAELEKSQEESTYIPPRDEIADVSSPPKERKKPARLKLSYRDVSSVVTEYRDNVRRGGCVVKTPSPLPVGRECAITVQAPGMDEPLSLSGTVTWVSTAEDEPEQEPSMHIEYQFEDGEREELEFILSRLIV